MNALKRYAKAKEDLRTAVDFLAMIGKPQNTTAKNVVGTIHGIEAKTTIHFQPYDGATNYHTNPGFDAALARAIRRHWRDLSGEAMSDLQDDVDGARTAAAAEYEAEFGKVLQITP